MNGSDCIRSVFMPKKFQSNAVPLYLERDAPLFIASFNVQINGSIRINQLTKLEAPYDNQ